MPCPPITVWNNVHSSPHIKKLCLPLCRAFLKCTPTLFFSLFLRNLSVCFLIGAQKSSGVRCHNSTLKYGAAVATSARKRASWRECFIAQFRPILLLRSRIYYLFMANAVPFQCARSFFSSCIVNPFDPEFIHSCFFVAKALSQIPNRHSKTVHLGFSVLFFYISPQSQCLLIYRLSLKVLLKPTMLENN